MTSSVSPKHLFRDCAYLGHERDWVDNLIERCKDWLKNNNEFYIPIIDYHKKFGWCFHSLMHPGGLYERKAISKEFDSVSPPLTEKKVENEIARHLKSAGENVRQQVWCSCGIADIVTDSKIYEVKHYLNSGAIMQAVGQVLCYRESINPNLVPVVAGIKTDSSASMAVLIKNLGVEVLEWEK